MSTEPDLTISPIAAYLAELHARHLGLTRGAVASYIPELAVVDPTLFGICLVTVDGSVYEVGDSDHGFTIQSISKALTFGAALEEAGPTIVHRHIGVEPTGDAFNSITLRSGSGTPYNPMVNAGAITAAGLVAELHPDDAIEHLLGYYSRFAGRSLHVDDAVRASEAATGHRNRAIAHLLRGSGALTVEPDEALDLYFRQCSVVVDCHDLGVIAATLANGGRNPITGELAAARGTVRAALTVMASCGMYDGAGEWLYTVGLPAKSGVGGGIIAVLPGQFGLAVFSPPLDEHGNSVRGTQVCRDISSEMGLHLIRAGHRAASPVRSIYTLAQMGSTRQRTEAEHEAISRVGHLAVVTELQGDLDFIAGEQVTRQITEMDPDPRFVVVDLRRVDDTHPAAAPIFARISAALSERGGALILTGTEHHLAFVENLEAHCRTEGGEPPMQFPGVDLAMEWCEVELGATRPDAEGEPIALREHELLKGLNPDQVQLVADLLETRDHPAGAVVTRPDDVAVELVLVTSGHLSVYLLRSDGSERRLATLTAGMLIGESALTNDGPRLVEVRTDTAVTSLVLSADDIASLRHDHIDVWAALVTNLLGIVSRRAERTRRELAQLAE